MNREDLDKAVQNLSSQQRAEVSEILEGHIKTFKDVHEEEMNEEAKFRLSDNARQELKYMIATFLLDKTATVNEAHHYISGYLAGYQSGRYE